MTEKKLFGQDMFDFILLHYGNLEFIGNFLSDNDIVDILFFEDAAVGTEFNVINFDLPVKNIITPVVVEEVITVLKKKVYDQNVFDFVITHYGNLEFLSMFLEDNDINDILFFGLQPVGTQFIVTPQSNRVVTNYSDRNYVVATGSNPPVGDFGPIPDDFNLDFFI